MSSPSDPDDDFKPRPLLTARFWALMIFAALCVLAGIGVAVLGPRFPPAGG